MAQEAEGRCSRNCLIKSRLGFRRDRRKAVFLFIAVRVSFGSLTAATVRDDRVRFTPESCRDCVRRARPLWAKSGLTHRDMIDSKQKDRLAAIFLKSDLCFD